MIAIIDKGASGYEDVSSSQEREMQSDCRSDRKIRKLRAELEEAEQARKDELVKKAKDKEARDKEAEVKEAKDRGGEGATGGAGEATRQWRVGTIRRSRATNKLRVTAAYFHPRRDGISQYRSGRSN